MPWHGHACRIRTFHCGWPGNILLTELAGLAQTHSTLEGGPSETWATSFTQLAGSQVRWDPLRRLFVMYRINGPYCALADLRQHRSPGSSRRQDTLGAHLLSWSSHAISGAPYRSLGRADATAAPRASRDAAWACALRFAAAARSFSARFSLYDRASGAEFQKL